MDDDGEPFYPSVTVYKCDAKMWLDVSRERVYVVAVSRKAGGVAGGIHITDIMTEITDFRRHFAPHPIKKLLAHVGRLTRTTLADHNYNQTPVQVCV